MATVLLSIFSLMFFSFAEPLQACASCGSGGDDPMVLYPSETWKAYIGLSRAGDFEGVNRDGNTFKEYGPEFRNITLVSFGRSFSPRFFGTVTAPYIVNKRERFERSGWGDPLTSLRYTVVQQSLADEMIPQIQLLASFRPGDAPSIYNYEDPAKLDVRGSGFAETRAGVDLWSGMSSWKYGFAQTFSSPVAGRSTEFGYVRPGVTYRSTATFGYGWNQDTKVVTGINRELVTPASIDGTLQPQTDSLQHGVFVSADTMVERRTSIRLTAQRAASLLANRNTNRNQSFSLAMTRSF